MKKFITVITLITIALVLASCGTKENNEINTNVNLPDNSNDTIYKIAAVTYTSNNEFEDIMVNYPQISNMADKDKEGRINQLIKDSIFKIVEHNKKADNFLTLEINHDIKFKDANILSIQYLGYQNYKGTAHPNNLVYTTNIDINRGLAIALKNIINIDKNFANIFKTNAKLMYMAGQNVEKETNPVLKEYLNTEVTDNELIRDLKANDAVFYFTKDSLGIGISVPHAIGDNLEYEVNYKDIEGSIKKENEIWKDLLKK